MSTERNIEICVRIYVGFLLCLSIVPYIHLFYVLIYDGCIFRIKTRKLQKHLHKKIKENDLKNQLIENYEGYDEL